MYLIRVDLPGTRGHAAGGLDSRAEHDELDAVDDRATRGAAYEWRDKATQGIHDSMRFICEVLYEEECVQPTQVAGGGDEDHAE
jgi:hypothetical protein